MRNSDVSLQFVKSTVIDYAFKFMVIVIRMSLKYLSVFVVSSCKCLSGMSSAS